MDLVEGLTGALDPGEGECGGQALQLGAEVGVAQEFGCAAVEQEKVFEQKREGAEQGEGFGLAVGPGAVGLGALEEDGVVGVGLS